MIMNQTEVEGTCMRIYLQLKYFNSNQYDHELPYLGLGVTTLLKLSSLCISMTHRTIAHCNPVLLVGSLRPIRPGSSKADEFKP